MYVKKSCVIHDKIEIEKHYSGRYGAPGMSREKKRKKTPEEMAEVLSQKVQISYWKIH